MTAPGGVTIQPSMGRQPPRGGLEARSGRLRRSVPDVPWHPLQVATASAAVVLPLAANGTASATLATASKTRSCHDVSRAAIVARTPPPPGGSQCLRALAVIGQGVAARSVSVDDADGVGSDPLAVSIERQRPPVYVF